jgi:hypothetical protein
MCCGVRLYFHGFLSIDQVQEYSGKYEIRQMATKNKESKIK